MTIVRETLSLAGSFDDFSLDEGRWSQLGSVSLGWIVLGVVNVITYTSDRLILTVLCRVESTFEGGVDGIRCVNTRASSHSRSV